MQEEQNHPEQDPLTETPQRCAAIFQHLRPALDRSPLAIAFVEGPTHVARYANPALGQLCGKPIGEIEGHGLVDIFPGFLSSRLRSCLDEVLSSLEPELVVSEPQADLEKGTQSWCCAIWPVLDKNNKTAGLLLTLFENKLQQHVVQCDALLESMAEGVAVFNRTGCISLNRAGRLLARLPATGAITAEDFKGVTLKRSDGSPLPRTQWPGLRAMRGECFQDQYVMAVWPDGRTATLIVSGCAVCDQAGDVLWAINVFRDVTELERLKTARDDFAGLVSHDLRGPLGAMLAHAERLKRLLARRGLDKEASSAELFVKSARRMDRMIDEMLEFARGESTGSSLRRALVDARELVREVVERIAPPDAIARIGVECGDELPRLWADPLRLDRAISNLVANALKYSPADAPITVRIDCAADQMTIAVEDRGLGIDAADLPHIFDKYYRAGRAAAVKGAGLGLYIAWRVIQAHGGRIDVESKAGAGSTFRIVLPLGPAGLP